MIRNGRERDAYRGDNTQTCKRNKTFSSGRSNLVSLETRNANTSGRGEITIRDLIRSALRMRPERIIVGEVRGAEALDMLQAIICTI